MSYNELRDKMASEYCGYETEPIQCFKAGWDAARANTPFDKEYDIQRCIELADERDQIAREYSTLKNQYYKVLGELTTERDQLRAEVEQLKSNQSALIQAKDNAIDYANAFKVENDLLKRQLEVMKKVLERLTKVGPPSVPTTGEEWTAQCLKDNCEIANQALAEVEKLEKK